MINNSEVERLKLRVQPVRPVPGFEQIDQTDPNARPTTRAVQGIQYKGRPIGPGRQPRDIRANRPQGRMPLPLPVKRPPRIDRPVDPRRVAAVEAKIRARKMQPTPAQMATLKRLGLFRQPPKLSRVQQILNKRRNVR